MRVRQACPSWQATLPPAALGEERQVSDQVCGASRLNASTAAVVAGELIFSHCCHRFWMKILPQTPHCEGRHPSPLTVEAVTTESGACCFAPVTDAGCTVAGRAPTVLLRRVSSPHPPLKWCSAVLCSCGAQVSGKLGEAAVGTPCLHPLPTPVQKTAVSKFFWSTLTGFQKTTSQSLVQSKHFSPCLLTMTLTTPIILTTPTTLTNPT